MRLLRHDASPSLFSLICTYYYMFFCLNCRNFNWKNNWYYFGKYVCALCDDHGDLVLQMKVRQEATAHHQKEKMVSEMCYLSER